MKKVGILTMHKHKNYGSALQAYATQYVLEKLGVQCEIIDYIYPNGYHGQKKSIKAKLKSFLLEIYSGFAHKKKGKQFNAFYKDYFKLSKNAYNSPAEILANPPAYNTYLVGSDQVWNVRYTKCDRTFFLSFAPKGTKKISYASSFGKIAADDDYLKQAVNDLKDFSAISVREKNAQKIIKNLLKKDVPTCIDPTLLLNKNEWEKLASQSKLKIDKPFALVYMLNYVYNPYPYANDFVRKVYEETGLHLVLLLYSVIEQPRLGTKDVTHLHDGIGPCDFLYLFQNASLVITSSFHGTAFALNFEKPFYSLIDNETTLDDRVYSLMQEVGTENRAVKLNSPILNISTEMDYTLISKKIEEKRLFAKKYLKENI
ncbi:MAG: polysaccharide pyruvyl transferase family protein [Dysgonamonadaceae bacterium]|jgi:hypothetical protein|nr:polysaccharide pyruvyl transferase family protein [Dysgonamonadaceae bacterium]